MSAFLFETDASQQNFNLIAPAGHAILAGNSVSYSYQGNTPSQVVYVFGQDFAYQGSTVVGGTPNLVLGTDNGRYLFEARLYGIADPSIQHLATLNAADQVSYLSSGDDYTQTSPGTARVNTLTGGAGNDTFDVGPGRTSIDGGAGTDTVQLRFNFADASVSVQNGTLAITAPGFQDQIVNVEQFQFNDRSFGSLAALQQAAGIGTGATLHNVYRFYNASTGDHFYTADPAEKAAIQASLPQYRYEGVAFATPDKGAGTVDVYRFYDTRTGDHFYTASTAERDQVLKTLPTYHYEGVAFEAYASPGADGTFALERFYNTGTNLHHYAQPGDEVRAITQGAAGPGWVDEGPSLIVHAAIPGA